MSEVLKTEFGNAKIQPTGYYVITSIREGHNGKKLHRLIFEKHHRCTILPHNHVHHIDGNKLNNDINNLELLSPAEHNSIHKTNTVHSEETKNKISNSLKGKKRELDSKIKISMAQNTSGFYRVSKDKCKECKKGYRWKYTYYENGKYKSISSVDLDCLKKKVLERGLIWKELPSN